MTNDKIMQCRKCEKHVNKKKLQRKHTIFKHTNMKNENVYKK